MAYASSINVGHDLSRRLLRGTPVTGQTGFLCTETATRRNRMTVYGRGFETSKRTLNAAIPDGYVERLGNQFR
jgi:hypothetical protein